MSLKEFAPAYRAEQERTSSIIGSVFGSARCDEDVAAVIELVRRWAAVRDDVHGLALVGSWARGEASEGSDVDLVLLVDQPDAYLNDDTWIGELGASALRTKSWGVLTERRLVLPSGLEIDLGIAAASWATAPVDAGTRRVVTDGIRVVLDPYGLLANLLAAITK